MLRLENMHRKRKSKRRGVLRDLVVSAIAVGFFGGGFLLLWAATLDIPDLASFAERKVAQSTKIYDRTGEVLLYDLHENIQRTVIPFDAMSRHIKNATVAIEDAEFYGHRGVRPLATFRAVFIQPLRGKGVQGGSTITQQVIKNSVLTTEKKISRKLKEWVLAWKLEQEYSKEKILELYLNESPYGGSVYGVEEASQMFFGKSAADLSLTESAYLAALPQAPTYYSPYGNHTAELEERKNLILSQMLRYGFITEEERAEAEGETVVFAPKREQGVLAPHFVFFIEEYLENKYGKRVMEEDGLKVTTTLDYALQSKAEEIVKTYALQNAEAFNAENAGLVAIDPKTGEILVMVGSRDYFDDTIDGNFNITLAKRQPGSAFKPFVYATAFKKGYTPETVVFDVATQFQTTCPIDQFDSEGECYAPTNYDNIFRGPVSLRNALAQSINIPAIKVLYLAGFADSLRTAKDLGITSLTDSSRYGLTLVLGGGEVSPLEITSAYGVFGNDGVRNPPVGVLRIEDSSGNVVEEIKRSPEQVLDAQVARLVSDVLNDNTARTPAFGAASPLYFPGRDVAVKTGTTNDYRDAWTVGYTPNIAVGAWAGNNDNSSMEKKVAGFIITPLWHAFMEEALAARPVEYFKKPAPENTENLKPILKGLWQGGVSYVVDTVTGKLATNFTPLETREERVVPDIHSILHWVEKENPRGPVPEKPEQDPQYERWEYGVAAWIQKEGVALSATIPTEYDDVHGPLLGPRITITSPLRGASYAAESKMTVSVQNTGTFPLSRVEYFVNGVRVGTTKNAPFLFSFVPEELGVLHENNTLTVVVYDSVQNRSEAETTFRVLGY